MKRSALIVSIVALLWHPVFAQTTAPGGIVVAPGATVVNPRVVNGKPESSSAEALLKARIVQLEAQLTEAVRRINLLTAQLSEAQQPMIAQDQQKKRAEAEKEAGCQLDWAATPPVCQPEKPAVPKR